MNKAVPCLILTLLSACSGPARTAERETVADCDNARVIAKLPQTLNEVSGIAASARHPGIFWVHTDDSPAILAIDSTGAVRAQVRVSTVKNRDWEDIAVAPCATGSCLFIGEIGDNDQSTKRRVVYRVEEPALADTVTSVPTEYAFKMPDKQHDSEALAVLPNGRMFVITKGRSGPITVFTFPQPLVENDMMVLEPVGTLSPGLVQLPEMVTGASAYGANTIALRTYGGIQFYRVDGEKFVAVYGTPFDLQALAEPQGEGIAVRSDGSVFLTSEKGVGQAPLLSRVQCALPD